MNWILLFEILYLIALLLLILRVLYDTRSGIKALAYILFMIFVPFLGMLFYFSFGTNYRKHKLYSKKLIQDEHVRKELRNRKFAYYKNDLNSQLIT